MHGHGEVSQSVNRHGVISKRNRILEFDYQSPLCLVLNVAMWHGSGRHVGRNKHESNQGIGHKKTPVSDIINSRSPYNPEFAYIIRQFTQKHSPSE